MTRSVNICNGALLIIAALCTNLAAQSNPPTASLAQQVAAEIAAVRAGTTPAAWLRDHPAEKLEPYNGKQLNQDTEKWCARATATHAQGSALPWTRTVYFYQPPPPADDALPPPDTAPQQLVENSCRLGLLWFDIPESDPSAGVALVHAIAAALTSQYGKPQVPRLPGGFGSAGWAEVRQWQARGAVITAAYDKFGGVGHRALVRVAFPNSDAVHDLAAQDEQAQALQRAELDDVLRRVANAGMPAAVTAEMTALLRKPDFFAGTRLPQDTQVVAAFRHWIDAAQSLPAGHRAMALLAADCALDFLDHSGVQMGDAAGAQMATLGARYVPNPLAGGPVYAHGWLLQAKAMVPPGYGSDEVLLVEMARGFDENGMCGGGGEEFAPVIRQGESLLAGARSLPPQTLASLHFMVADAYATIVWLATTPGDDYHDPAKYRPQEAVARVKALEQYRAALALEHGTARSHAAWSDAWRLAAGLPPQQGRYFCIYD